MLACTSGVSEREDGDGCRGNVSEMQGLQPDVIGGVKKTDILQHNAVQF